MDEHSIDIKKSPNDIESMIINDIESMIINNIEKFRDQIISDVTDIIEKTREQIRLDVLNSLEKSRFGSSSKKDKSMVTKIMEKYIDDHYIKTNTGKVSTTYFNDKILSVLEDEGYTVGVKGVPYLMVYVFGFDRVKTCGDWYYTGLEEKPIPRPKLIVLPNH